MADKLIHPEDLEELFYDAQKARIFADEKLFADARAKMHPAVILKTYREQKDSEGFTLREFIDEYFDIPNGQNKIDWGHDQLPIEEHIEKLWQRLKRIPQKKSERSSKINLPFPYIVPGGRFDEIYYWDSYFTMLGLKVSGEIQIIEDMVNNFTYLINTYGHIPNGNRSYFLSRSQPPFYSLMVKLLIELKGKEIIPTYLSALVKEYNFWMDGTKDITDDQNAINRVVRCQKRYLLNRYYDAKDTPREEMYGEDWHLIDYNEHKHNDLYRNIRSACESGWDFSGRWLRDPQKLTTIHTTEILPIDLNCLIWHLEQLISECYNAIGKDELSLNYGILAVNRKKAIHEFFWNDTSKFYFDYDFVKNEQTDIHSLAGVFPLYFRLASEEQAKHVADLIEEKFLKAGGVVTTLLETGQQWDSPNGWAPLQWMTVKGLLNYGHKSLAQEIAHRWTALNKNVYKRTGKMLEKYNVVDTSLEGGGGEYPVQDGFGWTNGVYLALSHL